MPLSEPQIRSAVGLLQPLGRILELTHAALLAHHEIGEVAEDCPVCLRFQDQMEELINEWNDARAQAVEHWDV